MKWAFWRKNQQSASVSSYGAADFRDSEVAGWRPHNFAADAHLLAERGDITARSRDMARNNGWVAGGVVKEVDAVIGASFRPSPQVDRRALGIEAEEAAEVSEAIQAAWREWADDPRMLADASRCMPVSHLFGLAYRHYLLDGDALAVLHWREDRPWRTVVRVVDPDLLQNPFRKRDAWNLRGGVELDMDGAAVGYHFRSGHEHQTWHDPKATQWVRIERETEWGRPQVVHFFDKGRDGQSRGISRLAPIMEKLKMEDRYGRVELQAAVLNAILGVFITSPFDSDSIPQMLSSDGIGYQDARAEFHKQRKIELGGVRIPHLFMGEDIKTTASRQLSQFADFERSVLRHIASGMGISYEQLAADWSDTNYSSARAALLEIWRGWTSRRSEFGQRFCSPIYMAFLEEAIDRGAVKLPAGAPAFGEAVAAWSRCKWIGPGKGFVDPVKEAQAAQIRIQLGISTLEDEAAELTGSDYEENLAQISREIDMMPEGVTHPAQRASKSHRPDATEENAQN